MPGINITVKNKIARSDGAHYVCGNSDFVANFKFDSEWDEYETKTARFSYNGSYVDVAFDGDQCPIPIISDTYFFLVGVYAGNLHTTTPARVPCKKSILCGSGSPADPTESVYNQLMEKLNDLDELSDEELAAAIDAYFAEHPVEQRPLRFTGAANATYDGSEAVEVFIPRMDANEYDPAKIITAQPYTANSLLTKYVAPSLLVSTESMIADGAETVVSQQFPNMYALGRCITQLHIALTSIKNLETAKQFVENAFTEFVQLLNGGYITLPFIVHYGISSGIDPNTQITIKRMRVFPEGVEAYSIAVQYGDGKLYMLRYDSVDDMSETTRTTSATVDNYYFTTVRTPLTVNRNLYPEADSGKVLTVNENGVIEPQALPTYTAAEIGAQPTTLVVNVSQVPPDSIWSADKNFEEITAAYECGAEIKCFVEGVVLPLIHIASDSVVFAATLGDVSMGVEIKPDDTVELLDASLALSEDVPNVPDWALAEVKPTYTADEVGAQPKRFVFDVYSDSMGLGKSATYEQIKTAYDSGADVVCFWRGDHSFPLTQRLSDSFTFGGIEDDWVSNITIRSDDSFEFSQQEVGATEGNIETALGYVPTKTWYVTVTKDGDSITADKTPEEIYNAYQAGFTVYAMTSTFPGFENVPFLIPCLAAVKYGSTYQIGFATSGTTSATTSPTSMVIFYTGSAWRMWGHKLVSDTDIVDNLTSDDIDKPLSANQGKVLKEMIDGIDIPDVPTTLPNPTALTIKSDSTEQSYDGSAARSVIFPWAMAQLYGALGDGTTDDTAAIQSALANNRYVYIPAGTYKLSGTLDIRDGCRLELAPDAILNFTQTSGNCITLGMSAELRGNFATIVVPYAFSGNVVYISTASSTTLTGVPPYTRWTPQWKPARYVSDICITKPDSRGFHYSIDGNCSGTAVYIEADGSATSTFIWGARLSGLRIAGAFSYGIHGKCLSEGWNHEMHLEAVIDACEIGVCLEDSNNNYITATIQPRAALTTDSKSVPYAKHGIQLIRCRNTDLSATRVWDWNATNALWTEGGEYQHIAMVGNCSGTILSDFLYYETSYDIRSLIYTDTASNFEKMTILQEPFTRWFKPSEDGLTPYFYNGTANKELLQKDAFDALFQVSPVANFTNKLPTAATADGSVYNSMGYKNGVRLADADGTTEATLAGNTITGFIPCAEGDIIRLKGISFATNTYSAAKVYLYKSDHTKLAHVNHSLLTTNGSYYNIDSYEATDEGCSFRIVNGSAAYFRLSVDTSTLTADPVVTVNEEITYSQAGFLADSVSVKASSVYGLEDYIKAVIAANG